MLINFNNRPHFDKIHIIVNTISSNVGIPVFPIIFLFFISASSRFRSWWFLQNCRDILNEFLEKVLITLKICYIILRPLKLKFLYELDKLFDSLFISLQWRNSTWVKWMHSIRVLIFYFHRRVSGLHIW